MHSARAAFALLLVISSACALALEVIWTRSLALLLGSGVQTTACVLAAFMLGLAGGARLGSWWTERLRHPLRGFAWVQALGCLAAPLPLAAAWAPAGLEWALGLAGTALASLPLGATFVLAGRVREADRSGRGGGLDRLAALDTAGALAGCLGAGLIALPLMGLRASLLGILGIKLALGLAALGLPDPACAPRDRPAPAANRPDRWLLALVAVQGLALLGAEAVWSRLLAFVLFRGSSTYALVAMLACVLAGQSLGALAAGRRIGRGRDPRHLALAWARACGFWILFSLAWLLVAGPIPSRAAIGPLDLAITLLACGPAAFFSGGVFAAACRTGDAIGAGWLLSANALGAMAGALLVPLALLPVAGLAGSLVGLALAPPVISLLAAWRRRPAGRLASLAQLTGLALLALGLVWAGPAWTRHLGPVRFYREGAQASVAVVEDPPGVLRLYVDGVAVAGTDLAMATDQKGLAHLPVLLHGAARSALTVGFGAGGTSRSMLLHPGLQVECVEIAPAVLAAADHLGEVNAGLLRAPPPRYRLHLADARRFLASSDRRWDVIVNDCTDLAYRSDAALYTREFFGQIHRRLAPGGLAAAWLPLRGQPPYRVLRSVVGGFADEFPQASLWVFDAAPVHFGILVGSDHPLQVDLDRLERSLADPAIRADLALVGLDDPARLAAARQLDRASLLRFAGSIERHSDDHPVVEYWAPQEDGSDASAYAALFAAGPAAGPVPATTHSAALRVRFGHGVAARPWLLAGHAAWSADRFGLARQLYLSGLRRAPADPALHRALGLGHAPPGDLDTALRLAARGTVRLAQGDLPAALEDLEAASVLRPHATGIRVGLALALAEAGRADDAERLYRAVLADPGAGPDLWWRARLGLIRLKLPWPLGSLTPTGL